MNGGFILKFKKNDDNYKVDFNNSKSKDLRETFKSPKKASKLSEVRVKELVVKSFSALLQDIERGSGYDYFDTLFNNIAFAKIFIDIIDKYKNNKRIERMMSRIIDLLSKYYNKEDEDTELEKVHYINNRYKHFLENETWNRNQNMAFLIKDNDIRFQLIIKSYNVRNAVYLYTRIANDVKKKPKDAWQILIDMMEDFDEGKIIGEILSTRKRLTPKLTEYVYQMVDEAGQDVLYDALVYFAKREKNTLAMDINKTRHKTMLLTYLENNNMRIKKIKSYMKEIIRDDITLVDTFDHILKNEELFKGERIYRFSNIENKNMINLQ